MQGLTLVVARPAADPAPADPTAVDALLAFLTEGATFHPRLPGAEAIPFLCEIAAASLALASRAAPRAAVRLALSPEPWELGVERAGRDVLVSLFQGGSIPEVALHERRVDGESFAAALLGALRDAD